MAEKLLLLLPNWLGDAVLSTGLLAGLAHLERPPVVDVCGNRTALAVAGGHRAVRRAILYERHGAHGRPRAFFALARTLRAEGYAAHIVLPPTPSAALFARCVGAPVRAGFDGPARRLFLSHRVRRGPRGSAHLLEEYRSVLALLERNVPAAEPEVGVEAGAARRAEELIGGRRAYAVIAPGATFGPTKRWPAERFARVAEALAARHRLAIVLVGGPGDAPATAAVRAELAGASIDAIDLAGRTDLGVLGALLAGAAVVVGNDSGPMHLARAVGAPVVGVFGSTEPRWTAPRGGRVVIAAERPPCAPCYRRTCAIDFVCLTRIPPEAVVAAAEAALVGEAR
jgi:heptosyltransferase-2